MDWLDLLAVQGTLKSLLQHHSSTASILQRSAFFIVQLSHLYMTTGKTTAITRRTSVDKVMSLLLNMLSRWLPNISLIDMKIVSHYLLSVKTTNHLALDLQRQKRRRYFVMMSTISRRNTQQIATTQNNKNDYRIQELYTGQSNSNYNSNLALSFNIHGELVFKQHLPLSSDYSKCVGGQFILKCNAIFIIFKLLFPILLYDQS